MNKPILHKVFPKRPFINNEERKDKLFTNSRKEFIFIKNYKTAGSSIETYLYKYLTPNDIAVGTVDFKGINSNYNLDDPSFFKYFEPSIANKQKNKAFFCD